MPVCAQATPNGRQGSDGFWLRMNYGKVSASSALVFLRPGNYRCSYFSKVRSGAVQWPRLAKVLRTVVQAVGVARVLLTMP